MGDSNNNDIYANAAYVGFCQGILAGRSIADASIDEIANMIRAAGAFSIQVDSLIPFDPTTTVALGTPAELAPTTSAIIAAEQWKGSLLQSLCASYYGGRVPPLSTNPADYNAAATQIVQFWGYFAGALNP